MDVEPAITSKRNRFRTAKVGFVYYYILFIKSLKFMYFFS